MSMASDEAARARREAASTLGYYNLTVGPTRWKFGAGLGMEYTDNVSLSSSGKESDFSFRPQANTEMLWPITDKNSLNFNVGVGYAAYVKRTDLDRIFVTPGSELSFDLYVGDVWVNLHDRFSITEDSFQDPTVSGTGDYARLENAVGASALWDLNKVILRLGYDHVDYISLISNSSVPDGQSEIFSGSAGYVIKPDMQVGIELGGGLLSYSGANAPPKATQWSAGTFFDTQVSDHIHFRGSVGYTVYSPDSDSASGGTNAAPKKEFSGVYAQVAISHQLNDRIDYSLSGGRSLSFAFFGGTIDLYFARLQANWKIMQKVTIGTSLDYEHGSQVAQVQGPGDETFDRYSGGITLGRAITKKLSGSIGYRFLWRRSDLSGQEYTANVASVNLNYAF